MATVMKKEFWVEQALVGPLWPLGFTGSIRRNG